MRPPFLLRQAVLLAILVALAIPACRCPRNFTATRQGEALLSGLSSYSSVADLASGPLASRRLELVEETEMRARNGGPDFVVRTMKTDFDHLGETGELLLTFFNDRLYGTAFYPSDMESYLLALKRDGLDLPRGSEPLELSDHIRIWNVSSQEEGVYVAWRDERLLTEHETWLRCYE